MEITYSLMKDSATFVRSHSELALLLFLRSLPISLNRGIFAGPKQAMEKDQFWHYTCLFAGDKTRKSFNLS